MFGKDKNKNKSDKKKKERVDVKSQKTNRLKNCILLSSFITTLNYGSM